MVRKKKSLRTAGLNGNNSRMNLNYILTEYKTFLL